MLGSIGLGLRPRFFGGFIMVQLVMAVASADHQHFPHSHRQLILRPLEPSRAVMVALVAKLEQLHDDLRCVRCPDSRVWVYLCSGQGLLFFMRASISSGPPRQLRL
jgi:hypothetical protein